MKPNVLIVDDDTAFLRLIQKDLEGFLDSFTMSIAESARSALEMLSSTYVSMVVSDLRMPGMDGFEFLAEILKKYPDIPVYVMTSFDKPKTREVVLQSGAAGYLKKPFTAVELFAEITKTLNKIAEGGSLHNVTLETFLQLIEMEQQTSTLRVVDKKGRRAGVLFFRDGELMNARIGDRQGKDAAYEILSWSNVSLSIEHTCVFTEKMIQGDLQAILLDAMRAKDELAEAAEEASGAGAPDEILLDSPMPEAPAKPAAPESAPMPKPAPKTPPPAPEIDWASLSLIEIIRMKIKNAIGERSGVKDIYHDASWDALLDQAATVGNNFNCGQLNVMYVNRDNNEQFVVVPGAETTAVALTPEAPWDRILGVLG